NPRKFPERAKQRRNVVIGLMRNAKLIDSATAKQAEAYPLRLIPQSAVALRAPYFIEWVRQQLEERFGHELYERGLKVYTSLDLDVQASAERSMERQLRAIENGQYGQYPHVSYEQYMSRV